MAFFETINDLHAINPNMDVLVLNGYNVDQGIENLNLLLIKKYKINKEYLLEKIG